MKMFSMKVEKPQSMTRSLYISNPSQNYIA